YSVTTFVALYLFSFSSTPPLPPPSTLFPYTTLFRSTFKRPVSSWKALNLRKTLLMASSVRLTPLNCSRLPCVYAQETLTFLLTQKKTCVKNYVQKEDRKSGSAGMPRPNSYAVFCSKKKKIISKYENYHKQLAEP